MIGIIILRNENIKQFASYYKNGTFATNSIGAIYEVIIIESCQYFYIPNSPGSSIPVHKGNCTNIIHSIKLENKL